MHLFHEFLVSIFSIFSRYFLSPYEINIVIRFYDDFQVIQHHNFSLFFSYLFFFEAHSDYEIS